MEQHFEEINEEIKENNIKIAKDRLRSINREKDEFNFVISDSKLSSGKRSNYNRKKLNKLSS